MRKRQEGIIISMQAAKISERFVVFAVEGRRYALPLSAALRVENRLILSARKNWRYLCTNEKAQPHK